MNLLGAVGNGLIKIFFTENALLKHVSLFCVTGLISVGTIYFQTFAERLKTNSTPQDVSSLVGIVVLWVIALLIITVYMCGYNIKFLHNSYDDESNDVLPNIDETPFGMFFKAFPLLFVWNIIYGLIYYVLFVLLTVICFSTPFTWPLAVVFLIVFILAMCFIPFVFVAYAKNLSTKGLYKFTLPFVYLKHAFIWVLLCALIFIPIVLIFLFPSFLVGFIAGLFSDDSIPSMYLGGILGGYFGVIIQLLWQYCLVQIYREEIEPDFEVDYEGIQ